MHLVRCFTVLPLAISKIFEGWFCVFFCVCCLFCLGVCFVCFFVFGFLFVCLCFPHGPEINTVVFEVVCEVEGPSELSWRARHGRKKIVAITNIFQSPAS